MGEVKVLYDREGSTLTVWFGNPTDEHSCEETGEGVVLIKDTNGQVIGFEKLHFVLPVEEQLQVRAETVTMS